MTSAGEEGGADVNTFFITAQSFVTKPRYRACASAVSMDVENLVIIEANRGENAGGAVRYSYSAANAPLTSNKACHTRKSRAIVQQSFMLAISRNMALSGS